MSATLIATPPINLRHPLAYIRASLDLLEQDERHLARWAIQHPCLAQVSTTRELIQLTHQALGHGSDLACVESADRAFRAVVQEHLTGDSQATMTCLLMLYPLLASSTRVHEADLTGDLVASAIAALPGVASAHYAFAYMKRKVATELRSRTSRRPIQERETIPVGLSDAIGDLQPLGSERQREEQRTRGEAWELLLDARTAGLITAEEARLLIEVHGLDPQFDEEGHNAVAARWGLSPATVRQRTSRVMRRLRQAIEDGSLVLD